MQPSPDPVFQLFLINSTKVLRRFGISEAVAGDMANAILAENRQRLKGLQIDFRNMTLIERQARQAQIKAEYNGRNHTALCKKYNISRRTLYRLLA